MRTIKFRAWDKKEESWVGGWCLHSSGLFSDIINATIVEPQHMAIADAHWREVPDHIVIQQFTGLTDKNGKEIYEGDVLDRFGYHKNWVVEIPEIFRAWQWFNGTQEIIGNIWENPELLQS